MALNDAKSLLLSPVSPLGLGDQLTQQLQDEENERKKKLMKATAGNSMGSAASMALLGGPLSNGQ